MRNLTAILIEKINKNLFIFAQDEPSTEDLDNILDIPALEEEVKSTEIRKVPPKTVNMCNTTTSTNHKKTKSKKFKDEESKRKWEEMMHVKRRKLFTAMVKKEVSKQQRSKVNKHKEALIQCKRAALQCQKVVRNKAVSYSTLKHLWFKYFCCYFYTVTISKGC